MSLRWAGGGGGGDGLPRRGQDNKYREDGVHGYEGQVRWTIGTKTDLGSVSHVEYRECMGWQMKSGKIEESSKGATQLKTPVVNGL